MKKIMQSQGLDKEQAGRKREYVSTNKHTQNKTMSIDLCWISLILSNFSFVFVITVILNLSVDNEEKNGKKFRCVRIVF